MFNTFTEIMKKSILIISIALLFMLYFGFSSFNSQSAKIISADSITIAKGETIFNQNCSSCHSFKQDGIGPKLGGLTDLVSKDWIKNFIRDPKKVIESGDERAQQLHKKYKVVMPSFTTLTGDEVNSIVAFLNTQKKPNRRTFREDDTKAISNPIPDTIKLSNLVVDLKLVTQIPSSNDKNKPPLARITKLEFKPGSGSLFIVDLRGKLYKLKNNTPLVYMDMAKLKPAFIDKAGLATGFGSFAFHPDFAKNGLFYTTHSEAPGSGKADFKYADSIKVSNQWVLTEWKAKDPDADIFSGTDRELFRANMVYVTHGIQEIAFNPIAKPGSKDYGMLYISVGDGGSVDEGFPFLAHSKDKVWGTILRIDPRGKNSVNGKYGIPKDNPFVAQTKTLGEIYAYGFRNPHRITWSKAGEMLVCNIGSSNIESVNLIKPGHDYGWPIREGTFSLNPYGDLTKVYPLPANDSIYKITYPVAQYDHDGGPSAISGGFEYGGNTIPILVGKFLFGDIASGRLFFIEMGDVKQRSWEQTAIKEWRVSVNGTPKTLKELCGNDRVDLHFGKDGQGELYILIKADGKIYKLVSAAIKPS